MALSLEKATPSYFDKIKMGAGQENPGVGGGEKM